MTRMDRVVGGCLPLLLIGGLALDVNAQPAPAPHSESENFLGVDPALAMILGAVLLIVIVIGIVAVSRRGDDAPDS